MSASFRNILQQVTQEKLEELKLQKNLLTTHFTPILTTPAETPHQHLATLYNSVRNSPVKDTIDPILIDNLKYLLQNSQQDPSISTPQLTSAWIERVTGEIQYALRKCEYSYLYGALLSEWLELEEEKKKSSAGEKPKEDQKTKEAKDAFLTTLKQLTFTSPPEEEFNPERFRTFLSKELFSFGQNVDGERAVQEILKETGDFFKPENYYISSGDVKFCIKGLNSDELLSPEKKAALKELADNPEALEEVASLLTNRLKNLDRWDWPGGISEGVTEIRRGLAGEYRPFLNEDIITALFLQYVGVEWAAFFKRQFTRILDSKGWLKRDFRPFSIEGYREHLYRDSFLSSLPDSVQNQEKKVKEEYVKVEAQSRMMRCAEMAMDYESDDMPGSGGALFGAVQANRPAMMMNKRMAPPPRAAPTFPKQDIDLKQQFLHVLCTEMKLNSALRPEQPLIVVQANLESFAPSIIHPSILIVLEFLGVHKRWLTFFQKFLQPKIKFSSEDSAQTVQRGVPTAHVLSNLFGETLLFLLEFLVNRKSSGLRLLRIEEELWFWGHTQDHVTKAWECLETYGKMVGLKVNLNQSGSASVFSEDALKKKLGNKPASSPIINPGPQPLPQKNIHWGYLELYSDGVFRIDEASVDKFLEEMRALLEKSQSPLDWINIFNKYFTFFIRNFGKTAIASGKQHLDQIVTSLNKIYKGLPNPDPVSLLKLKFPKLQSSIDAWVYWPLERGGLGLINPFIAVMALRESYTETEKNSAEQDFSKLPFQDKQIWDDLKKEHERVYGPSTVEPQMTFSRPGMPMPPLHPKLPTFEEYIATRETDLEHWQRRYLHLLERLGPKYPMVSEQFHTMNSQGNSSDDEVQRNYFMWLFTYYETQLKAHFGNVTFINAKLLPMSMIGTMKGNKVEH